jgi:hypothetical protein
MGKEGTSREKRTQEHRIRKNRRQALTGQEEHMCNHLKRPLNNGTK